MNSDNAKKVGAISSLRGFMVEVEVLGDKPEERELLAVENHPEIFLEVSYFKSGVAVCINLTNSPVLRCGMNVFRGNKKVSVPVGPKTLGRVFNALGEPLDEGEGVDEIRRNISEPSGIKKYRETAKNWNCLLPASKLLIF
jgi:F-type H+-transporting ATPase subunit beta